MCQTKTSCRRARPFVALFRVSSSGDDGSIRRETSLPLARLPAVTPIQSSSSPRSDFARLEFQGTRYLVEEAKRLMRNHSVPPVFAVNRSWSAAWRRSWNLRSYRDDSFSAVGYTRRVPDPPAGRSSVFADGS